MLNTKSYKTFEVWKVSCHFDQRIKGKGYPKMKGSVNVYSCCSKPDWLSFSGETAFKGPVCEI